MERREVNKASVKRFAAQSTRASAQLERREVLRDSSGPLTPNDS